MNQSEFRWRLLRFSLVPLLIVCAFVTIISLQLHQITQRRQLASQATLIVLQCNRLLNSLVDEESGVRGFIISGDPAFLQPYTAAKARVVDELRGLDDLVPDDTALEQEIREIRADFDRFTAVNQQIVDSDATRRKELAPLLQQKQAMDRLRAKLQQLTTEQSTVREEGRQSLTKLYATLPIIAIAGGAIVAFCLILDGIIQFRRISRAFGDQIREVELQRNSLQTTLQSIGDAVVVCDAKSIITIFNPTAESVTGWSADQAVGQPLSNVFTIVNEYTREDVESPVEKVLRTGQVVGLANHTVLIRKDGAELAIDDSGAPIRGDNNEIVGVILVFRDIAAKRKAEQELALRNAELESLLANSPIGFASFDRSHRFTRVNKSLAGIDGIPVEAHLGKPLAEVVPASSETFSAILDSVFKDGVHIHREFTGRRSSDNGSDNGIERQWLTWFYPVYSAEKAEPLLAGAIVLDNTERWQAQEALVRTEKLVAVGRLAASIAHEMNNPLTSVTNLLYLIGIDPTLNETTRGFVERANIELDRVSKMATQTLRFVRRTVAPAEINPEEIVTGINLLFSGRLSQNRIRVTTRKRNVSRFYGYSSEVMQLLTNLVSNAIDAIGSNGNITIAIQNSRDWQSSTPCVSISVADSGPGIAEQYRKKVWEPFFTTKADTGTGLGLWLVEETVRKNGGSIRMRTSTGTGRHGTVFRLLLPLQIPAAAGTQQPA
jgi:PAS domain S-box-containing protein